MLLLIRYTDEMYYHQVTRPLQNVPQDTEINKDQMAETTPAVENNASPDANSSPNSDNKKADPSRASDPVDESSQIIEHPTDQQISEDPDGAITGHETGDSDSVESRTLPSSSINEQPTNIVVRDESDSLAEHAVQEKGITSLEQSMGAKGNASNSANTAQRTLTINDSMWAKEDKDQPQSTGGILRGPQREPNAYSKRNDRPQGRRRRKRGGQRD